MLGRPGGASRQSHPQQSQPQPHPPPSRPHARPFVPHQAYPPNYSPPTQQQKHHQPHPQAAAQQQWQQHQQQGGAVFDSPNKRGNFSQVPGRPQFVSDPVKEEQGQELKTNPPQVSMYLIY